MAMRLQIVSDFFSLLLPGLGIGVAVLVVVLVLSGLFLQKANWRQWMPTFFWGGVIIALIIVISVLNSFAWFGSVWWQVNWVSIVWIILWKKKYGKDPTAKTLAMADYGYDMYKQAHLCNYSRDVNQTQSIEILILNFKKLGVNY
jgi:hypothetical protein